MNVSVEDKDFKFLLKKLDIASNQAYAALAQLKDCIETLILLNDKIDQIDVLSTIPAALPQQQPKKKKKRK